MKKSKVAKKAAKKKSPKKASPAKKKASPKKKPAKKLAQKAMKKNVIEGEVQGERLEKALRVEGPKDLNLEEKIKSLEQILTQCAEQKVEEHEIQRFLGRICTAAKSCGFLMGMSHAIFKREHDHIRLLEASLNESNLDFKDKKKLLDKLLSLALPKGLDTSVLEQSKNGNSWIPKDDPSDSMSEGELKIDTSTLTDTLIVEEATTQTAMTAAQNNHFGKIGMLLV